MCYVESLVTCDAPGGVVCRVGAVSYWVLADVVSEQLVRVSVIVGPVFRLVSTVDARLLADVSAVVAYAVMR